MRNIQRSTVVVLLAGILTLLTGCEASTNTTTPLPQTNTAVTNTPTQSNTVNTPNGNVGRIGLQAIHMVDYQNGFAQSGGTLYHTTDGGYTWQTINVSSGTTGAANSTAQVQAAQFVDATTLWVTTADGNQVHVLKSSNTGATWQSSTVNTIYDSAVNVHVQTLDMVNATTGYMMVQPDHGMNSAPGELLSTKDGGKTWSIAATTAGDGSLQQGGTGLPFAGHVAFADGSHGWVAGGYQSTGQTYLYETRNGGASWSKVTLASPQYSGIAAVLPESTPVAVDEANGYYVLPVALADPNLVVQSRGLYVSTDGGSHWSSLVQTTGGFTFSFPTATQGFAFFAGMLQSTQDAGRHWTHIPSDAVLRQTLTTTPNVLAVDFISATEGWLLMRSADGGQTALLHTTNGGLNWSIMG